MTVLNFNKDCLRVGDACIAQDGTLFTVLPSAELVSVSMSMRMSMCDWNDDLTNKFNPLLTINKISRDFQFIWTRPAKVSFIVGIHNPSIIKDVCFDAVMPYPAAVASQVFIAAVGNSSPPFNPTRPYNMGLCVKVSDAKHFDGDENSDEYKRVYSLFQNSSNLVTFYFYNNTRDTPIYNQTVFNADWTKTIQFSKDGEALVSTTNAFEPEVLWEVFRVKIGDDNWAYLSGLNEQFLTFDDEQSKAMFVFPGQHERIVNRVLSMFTRGVYDNKIVVRAEILYYTKSVATAFMASTQPNKTLDMPNRSLTIYDSYPGVSTVIRDERVCVFVMQYGNMPETYVMNDANGILLWTTTKTDAKQYKVQSFTPISELIIQNVTSKEFANQACKVMCYTYAQNIVRYPGREPFAKNVIVSFHAKPAPKYNAVMTNPTTEYRFEYTFEGGSPMGHLKSDYFYKLTAPSLIMAIETFKRIHPSHRQGQIQKINDVPYQCIEYFLNQVPIELHMRKNSDSPEFGIFQSIIDMF